jgi:hypothetical protein
MKNKHLHSHSAGSPSASDELAAMSPQNRRLAELLRNHLAIPTPQGFLAAHAKALDTAPVQDSGSNLSYVSLFGPATSGEVQFERRSTFSPKQRQRLDDVANAVARNPRLTDKVFLQRACAALDRIPLGMVFITANAAASPIPGQTLYHALLAHRRCPETFRVPEALQSGPLCLETTHSAPDGAWPEFVIETEPDGDATLIYLSGEVPE